MTYDPYQKSPGACPEFEALLEDRISGEISNADAAALDAHLASCSHCAQALAYVEATPRLLRIAEPAADPGPSFAHLTMAHIRQSREVENQRAEEKSIWNPFVSLAWKFAATSAVAVALLLSFGVTRNPGAGSSGSYISSGDDSGLFSDSVSQQHNDREDFLLPDGAEGTHGR
jgi:anti-sigma factor RsiW